MPAGFGKTFTRGYGFTRELGPLIYRYQDTYPELEHVIISRNKSSAVVNKKEVIINLSDIEKARPSIKNIQEKHREEQRVLCANLLSDIFPAKFKRAKNKYIKNSLYEFISSQDLKIRDLSDGDVRSLAELISKIPSSHNLIKTGGILAMLPNLKKKELRAIKV